MWSMRTNLYFHTTPKMEAPVCRTTTKFQNIRWRLVKGSTIASYIANRRWAMGYPFLVKEVSEVPNENPLVHDDPDLFPFS